MISRIKYEANLQGGKWVNREEDKLVPDQTKAMMLVAFPLERMRSQPRITAALSIRRR
jgi:hypothetical protein